MSQIPQQIPTTTQPENKKTEEKLNPKLSQQEQKPGFMEKLKGRIRMEGLLKQARSSLESFINPELPFEKQIPIQLLNNAKGIVFLTIIKAGFVFSGEIASGVIITRDSIMNKWSQPIAIGAGGIGWGLQIGASKVDCIMVLNTINAVKLFTKKGQLKLGSDLNISAGPKGRNASISLHGNQSSISPIVSYSMAKGAYVGLSLNGSIITVRSDCNSEFYSKPNTTIEEILQKDVKMPTNEDYNFLCDRLNKYINSEKPFTEKFNQDVNKNTDVVTSIKEDIVGNKKNNC